MKNNIIYLFITLLFFILQDALRIFPSLIKEDLIIKFNWSASDYGFFTALYYLGYAFMQIPVSIALDGWGLRKTMIRSILLTALGTLLLSYNNGSSFLAFLSRFLVGAGSSVGFLSITKVVNKYFIKKDLVLSFAFSIGLLGLLSNVPMSILLEQNYSWLEMTRDFTVALLIMALIAFVFLPKEQQLHSLGLNGLKELLTNKKLLILSLINFLLVGALEGFADVWGLNYLLEITGLEKSLSAEIMSFVFIGMLFGSPLLNYLSKKFGYYNLVASSGLFLALAVACFPLVDLTINQMIFLAFLIGIFSCYQVLIIILGSEIAGPSTLPIGLLNTLNMLGGAFFHWIVGYSLSYLSQDYSYKISYSLAILTIPLAAVLGSFLVFFMKK